MKLELHQPVDTHEDVLILQAVPPSEHHYELHRGTSLARSTSGQNDRGNHISVTNVLYFTVMEIIWDCPRVTTVALLPR